MVVLYNWRMPLVRFGPDRLKTMAVYKELAALPLDTRPCISRFALVPGFVYRKVTMLTWAMLTQRSCCLLQRLPESWQWVSCNSSSSVVDLPACWVPSRLCWLLLSSTAAETPATELLRSSVSHARQLIYYVGMRYRSVVISIDVNILVVIFKFNKVYKVLEIYMLWECWNSTNGDITTGQHIAI